MPSKAASYQIEGHRKRGKTTERGYGRDWQRLRLQVLQAQPGCHDCGRPANEVHHIERVSHRPELRLDHANLVALCQRCHSARTRAGE